MTSSGSERAFGFPAIYQPDAVVLVLGSMPSVKSLARAEYYAHPRNAFWPAMACLLDFDRDAAYAQRCKALCKAGIAVWDVLASCRRAGSLDSAIERQSEQVNDFAWLGEAAPNIKHVYFNGQKAEASWRRARKQSDLLGRLAELPWTSLPSTSPAHASLTLSQKIESWSIVVSTARSLRARI